ncbi:testis-specific serine/threonine-protein kinase 4-like [Adelges cooleyi]|uniref:testis-specific serine/threonine-protein kinase 4-like n=1 Tax=Adelges cooleyi TaxID=133065 RepID=UPI00217FD5E7|nr:testis-specific serine/threonine-protein kinase 4-like [Adelges cooleyi]
MSNENANQNKPSTANVAKQEIKIKSKESGKTKEKKLTVLESHGYTVGRSIGSGSYATVKHCSKIAHSERHNGDVAIKIVSKVQEAADYLEKFLPREIQVVKGLKHENLIRYYQAIETTHRVYIVMELAPNGSLLDIIKRDGRIDEDRTQKWLMELVGAVGYCHENGVVHRDIKCENLLMDDGYNMKLSDFGFARADMLNKNGQMAMSNTFCGSYAYASPEILKGTPYQPDASDVWSVGVVLYAMVFGTLPFDDTNYQKLLKEVQNKVSFPEDVTASEEVKQLIVRILAPLKVRYKISQIKKDPWCQTSEVKVHRKKKTAEPKMDPENVTQQLIKKMLMTDSVVK